MNRVTVFCSSSERVSPLYYSEMEILARGLANLNIEVVYGGARVGLMGHLADRILQYQGRVVGVIPDYLNRPGIVHEGLSELHVVNNLLDRKRTMLLGTDAVIACPGGMGTIDEVTEVLALKQLGEFSCPVLFLDFLDCWHTLFDFFVELKERGMISQELDELYISFSSSQDLLKYIMDQ